MNITINATEDARVTINTIAALQNAGDTAGAPNTPVTEALIDNIQIDDQTSFYELMNILRARPETREAAETEKEIQEEERILGEIAEHVREELGCAYAETLSDAEEEKDNSENLKKGKRRPGAIMLRTSVARIGKVKIGEGILEVFCNGYAIYDNGDRKTVLWAPGCGTYTYYFGELRENEKLYQKARDVLDENILGPLPWFHALMLAGESQIENNMQHPKSRGTASDADQQGLEEKVNYRWVAGAHFDNPEEAYLKKEAAEARRKALTEKQREAYEMYYEDGFTEEETAELLGISRRSLRDRLKFTRQKFASDTEKYFS